MSNLIKQAKVRNVRSTLSTIVRRIVISLIILTVLGLYVLFTPVRAVLRPFFTGSNNEAD